jgi:hypothetical protein
MRAPAPSSALRPRVARLLHPDAIPGIEQHAADQLEALLGTSHDQDLVGAEAGAPRGLHVVSDRLAQGAQPRRLAVVELGRRDRAQPPAREPPPERRREQVHAGRPDAKGARPLGHRSITRSVTTTCSPVATARSIRRRAASICAHGSPMSRRSTTDVSSPTVTGPSPCDAPLDIAQPVRLSASVAA